MTNHRPRVALLCDYALLPQRIGGMDRFFWALHQAIAGDWNVTWLFPAGADPAHYRDQGLSVVGLPKAEFLPAATAYLAAHPVDLLVSHFVPYATRYSRDWQGSARRYIAVDHMSRPVRRPRGWAAHMALKGVALYPAVHRVVAVSGFVRHMIGRELGPHWRGKTRVILNGVDPAQFAPGPARPAERPLHAVITAHLMAEKGVQVALAALAQAGDQLPLRLSVAGSGPYEAELHAQAAALGLGARVQFLGSITGQGDLLRSADLALVPSLWQEACPFAVIEALAAGLPLVAARSGGVPELIGEAGVIVPPGDAAALAAALTRLAGDDAERVRLGQTARQRVLDQFTLPRMVRDHQALMAAALGAG